MNANDLFEIVKILGPALAAWVSVKVTLAVALERAENALAQAQRAHDRLDAMQACKTRS